MKKKKGESNKHPDCGWTIFTARILLVAVFAMSLLGKLFAFKAQASWIDSVGLPIPGEMLLVGAIVLEIIGVVTILSGWNMRWGCYALIIFTVASTIMFHNPLMASPEEFQTQLIALLKNLGLIGGLLLLSMSRPGKLAIEK